MGGTDFYRVEGWFRGFVLWSAAPFRAAHTQFLRDSLCGPRTRDSNQAEGKEENEEAALRRRPGVSLAYSPCFLCAAIAVGLQGPRTYPDPSHGETCKPNVHPMDPRGNKESEEAEAATIGGAHLQCCLHVPWSGPQNRSRAVGAQCQGWYHP